VDDLRVSFPLRRSLPELAAGRPRKAVKAVDGVSLSLKAGQIDLLGALLAPTVGKRSRDVLRHLQMVAQNPQEALNPYLTIGESLSRPLAILLGRSPAEARAAVGRLLEAVRLPADYAGRLPSQLSGGEKQRVAIARAFAANPDVLVADEPVSALDVSVQASILNLLNELQGANKTAILFISHDIAVVGYLADMVAVLYLGRLMEVAAAGSVFQAPHHPYTEALLSAVPVPDPTVAQTEIRLAGEVPSAVNVPAGCPFHTRCPRSLGRVCETQTPPWRVAPDGKRIFCHIPLDELAAAQNQ